MCFIFPHQLAYFNELAGGPYEGWRHLLGSNLDWDQDYLQLRNWLHVEAMHGHRVSISASGIAARFVGPHFLSSTIDFCQWGTRHEYLASIREASFLGWTPQLSPQRGPNVLPPTHILCRQPLDPSTTPAQTSEEQ